MAKLGNDAKIIFHPYPVLVFVNYDAKYMCQYLLYINFFCHIMFLGSETFVRPSAVFYIPIVLWNNYQWSKTNSKLN